MSSILEIEYKIRLNTEKLKKHVYYIILSTISEIFLSFLYYLFVIDVGNLFDIIASAIVLGFMLGLILIHTNKLKKHLKEKRVLEKEYKIACETPEERLARKRTEKFKRIIK